MILKRAIYLVMAALVAVVILTPTALAQDTVLGDDDLYSPEQDAAVVGEDELQKIAGQPLPKSGGLVAASVLLPAAALLLGSGVLACAVLLRRRG